MNRQVASYMLGAIAGVALVAFSAASWHAGPQFAAELGGDDTPLLPPQATRGEETVGNASADSFRTAWAIEEPERRADAIRHSAIAAAALDPRSALESASHIGNARDRMRYVQAVLDTWAALDSPAALSYLESDPDAAMLTALGWQALADEEPMRALELAERSSVDIIRVLASDAVLPVIAETDPESAIRFALLQDPNGVVIHNALRAVGRGYAARDSEAAWAWAASMQGLSNNAALGVIEGVATFDLSYALDLLSREDDANLTLPTLHQFVFERSRTGNWFDIVPALDYFAARGAESDSVLMVAAHAAAEFYPNDLLDWVLVRGNRFDAEGLFAAAASGTARHYPEILANTVNRIPPQLREQWVTIAARTAGGPGASKAAQSAAAELTLHLKGQALADVVEYIGPWIEDHQARERLSRHLREHGLTMPPAARRP